jgi:hypothetical protein
MAIQEKSRTLYICRESLIISDIEYLTKNVVYYLEDCYSSTNKPTYNVYDENNNEKHFAINKDLLGKYFITMAEYRDMQINSILE